MYLTSFDYLKQIQDVNLSQIISGNTQVLAAAQLAAEAEVKSYLRQKYDVNAEFTDTTQWNNTTAYKAGSRVYDGTNIYYGAYPKPQFNLYSYYVVGDEIFYKDRTYRCKSESSPVSQELALQVGTYGSLPFINSFPDAPNQSQWTDLGAYSIAAGTELTDTTKWVNGDNRDQQIVLYCVDICMYHIHSRIAPRNIPQLRQDRYLNAVEWLKMCAEGHVTPNLPILQPKQGGRIRFGGSIKNINSY